MVAGPTPNLNFYNADSTKRKVKTKIKIKRHPVLQCDQQTSNNKRLRGFGIELGSKLGNAELLKPKFMVSQN